MFVELKTVPQSWRMPYNVKTLTGHKYRVVHPAKNKLIQKELGSHLKNILKGRKHQICLTEKFYKKVIGFSNRANRKDGKWREGLE